jgi:hypothetical protein
MCDSHLFDLFTLARAFYLREHNSTTDLFMHVLFMGFWVERIESRHFDVETDAIIIETLLLSACVQRNLLELGRLREKPSLTTPTSRSLREQIEMFCIHTERAALGIVQWQYEPWVGSNRITH